MNPADLPCEETEIIELAPVDGAHWWGQRPPPDAQLTAGAHDGEVVLQFGDESVRARIVGPTMPPPGKLLTHRGPARVTVAAFVGERLRAKVAYWSWALPLGELPLELGLPDAALPSCRKAFGDGLTVDECLSRLLSEFVDTSPGGDFGHVVAAARGTRDGEALMLVSPSRRAQFVKDAAGKWILKRLLGRDRNKGGALHLLTGRVAFVDATAMSAVRGEADRLLDSVLSNRTEGFLNLWRMYNAKEWEIAKRKAADAGEWHYQQRSLLADGSWVFTSDNRRRWQVRVDDTVEIPEEEEGDEGESSSLGRPSRGPDGEDDAVASAADGGLVSAELEEELRARSSRSAFTGRVKHVSGGQVVLDPGDGDGPAPPTSGRLRLSLVGDKVRLARRLEAALLIINKATPMPTLGLLLERILPPVISRRTYTLAEVLPILKRVLKGRKLTKRQTDAVMMALNTPDLALIQGPPGTGKTTVITAIIACLAELEGSDRGPDIVVTSAQHEAVDNVARRSRPHSLPVSRFLPSGPTEEERGFLQKFQAELREQVESELANLTPDTPVYIALQRAREVHATLAGAPRSAGEVADLLRQLFADAARFVPTGLAHELQKREEALRRGGGPGGSAGERVLIEKSIKRIPTSAAAFSDNGPAIAARARAVLADAGLLGPEEAALLDEAADRLDPDAPAVEALVPRLAALRDALLDRIVVAPRDLPTTLDGDTLSVVARTIDALNERMRNGDGGEAGVLAELLDELETRPAAVEETISNWTQAVAATVQHVANKKLAELTERPQYSTVIIDEAARAHPLDLLIPMVRVGRRIILVGDHRQLPQMLDPDVERDLGVEGNPKLENILKQSLFEQLFETARRSTDITRTVTLDEQYRMHPALGEFVSHTFYPPEEQFHSPRAAAEFAHQTVYRKARSESVPAAWVQVNHSRADSERRDDDRSWYREGEADVVAKHVEALLKHPDARSLSVGVISFYGAQVRRIRSKLQDRGVLAPDGAAEPPALVNDPQLRGEQPVGALDWERLKLGTVDSFQGREFDVVFLSVVRSNRHPMPPVNGPDEDDLELAAWRRTSFGHLLLENRVNVAMSRQKRLLVVVGDAEQFGGAGRETAVPGMSRFLEICRGGRDGIILA